MNTITYMQLYDLRACELQLELFGKLFGDEVTITPELIDEHGHLFDAEWLARRTLPTPLKHDFLNQTHPLRAAHRYQTGVIWNQYVTDVRENGQEPTPDKISRLWEFDQRRADLRREYRRECWRVFAHLYAQAPTPTT